MEAWLGLIGAVVGAVVGWGLAEVSRLIGECRKGLKELQTAAFVCLDRLLKIQSANERGDRKQCDGEIFYLGGDLNRYRDAIAASAKKRNEHWPLYSQTRLLLLEHELGKLDQLVSRYEAIARLGD